eukprot:2615424-Pleurochrysis_carterae.AAC.2
MASPYKPSNARYGGAGQQPHTPLSRLVARQRETTGKVDRFAHSLMCYDSADKAPVYGLGIPWKVI